MTRILFDFCFFYFQFLLPITGSFRYSRNLPLTRNVGFSETRICSGTSEGISISKFATWKNFFREKWLRNDINPLDGRVNHCSSNAAYRSSRKTDTLAKAVFINPKSGGQLGPKLLDELKLALDEDQICNLNAERPSDKLQHLAEQYNSSFAANSSKLALCCGGDGTVRWIMDEAKKANLSSTIKFGLIPLGTGNDLFNHVVSSQYSAAKAKAILSLLSPSNLIADTSAALASFDSSSSTSNLDRWKMIIHLRTKTPSDSRIREIFDSSKLKDKVKSHQLFVKSMKLKKFFSSTFKKVSGNDIVKASSLRSNEQTSKRNRKEKCFNNYFGIGIDGAITAMYDNLRRDRPYLFFNKIANKFWYGMSWFYKLVKGGNINLSECLTLYCDNAKVPLPPGIRGVIVINIDSYASGTKLWQAHELGWRKQRSDDGIVEVVGIYGLAHLAQVKAGLRQPLLITQGRSLRIVTNKTLPMQVDGEPWLQSAMQVDISLAERVQILVPVAPS